MIKRSFIWGLTLFILGTVFLFINAYLLVFGEISEALHLAILILFQLFAIFLLVVGANIVNKTLE